MSDPDRRCVICGDIAIGNNFDTLSCASCKAFFRRHAVRVKPFKCHFGNKCPINLQTRNKCKKCRIDKCYAMGMNKNYILNTEEKERRNTIITANRQKRVGVGSVSAYPSSTGTPSPLASDENTGSPLDMNDIDIDCETPADGQVTGLADQPYTDIDTIGDDISDIMLFNDIKPDINLRTTLSPPVQVMPVYRPLTDYRNQLNELESSRLQELLWATSAVKLSPMNLHELRSGMMLFLKMDEHTRKMIKMCKRLAAFNTMCEHDKLCLIKHGCVALFYMTMVPNYNPVQDCWAFDTVDKTRCKYELENYRHKPFNLYEKYKLFYHQICREWDSDPMLINLLTAIVLFNPDRPTLKERHLVKLQREIYLYLLKRYLLLRYRMEIVSSAKFTRLLQSVSDLEDLNYGKRRVSYASDPKVYPSELLKEIFELPNNGPEVVNDSITANLKFCCGPR